MHTYAFHFKEVIRKWYKINRYSYYVKETTLQRIIICSISLKKIVTLIQQFEVGKI